LHNILLAKKENSKHNSLKKRIMSYKEMNSDNNVRKSNLPFCNSFLTLKLYIH